VCFSQNDGCVYRNDDCFRGNDVCFSQNDGCVYSNDMFREFLLQFKLVSKKKEDTMVKIPDLSKLTEKLDLRSFVSNVKSLVNPESKILKSEKGDPVGDKLAQISALAHTLAETQAQQAKDLTKLANLIKGVYDDLHREEKVVAAEKKAEAPAKPEVKSEPKAAEVKPEAKSEEDKSE